jgi:hypothetical protein
MCLAPRSPPPPAGGRTAVLGFGPLQHVPARRIRLIPGVPRPGTFRPQGLTTLPAAYAPPYLTTARRPPQRSWGSPFRVLLLPASGTPLGASPLLSFPPPPAHQGWPRLQRLTLAGKGPDSPPTMPKTAEPCPRGIAPLQGFLLRHLWNQLPGPSPSCPSGRQCSLRFHCRAGLQGIVCDGSGWSLSRLPAFLGFRASSIATPIRAAPVPGLWLHLGPR